MDNDISWTTIFHRQLYWVILVFLVNLVTQVKLVKRAFLVKSCKLGGSDESETVMSEWLVGQWTVAHFQKIFGVV